MHAKNWVSAIVVASLAFTIFFIEQYATCNNLVISKLGICRLQQSWVPSNRQTALKFSLLWMAPFFSASGYGSEALSYITGLSKTGRIASMKIEQHGDLEDGKYWNGLPYSTKELLLGFYWQDIEMNNTVIICHSEPGAWYPPLFQTNPCPPFGYEEPLYVIGRTMFETDRLTAEHVQRCNRMNEVWVPSQFNIDTFINSGVLPSKLVKVVQTVDVDFFDPSKVTPLDMPSSGHVLGPHKFLPKDSFLFLSIFKWEYRKGWDVLLKAYLQEFCAEDDVVLFMLTNAYHTDRRYSNRVTEYISNQNLTEPLAGWPALYVEDSHIPQTKLPQLYKAADAFVLPSRGEGWGRPYVEAMAMELPVIATNWSGMSEYMTEKNSYQIALDGMSEISDGAFKGHLWAEPSVRSLQRLMRRVVSHPSEAIKKGKVARRDMLKKYSSHLVSDYVLKQLQRIQKRISLLQIG